MNVVRIANNETRIRAIILDNAKEKNQIVHGASAFNIQSPDYLKKETSDYDVLTKRPKKSAYETARKLSRVLNKEVVVKKGRHPGTYKVQVDNKTVADYTQLRNSPRTVKSWGVKVKSINSIKRNAQRLVKNPKTEFRREKDMDTLTKIREIERLENYFL